MNAPPPHLVAAADLAPPSNVQLHRLRRALLGSSTEPSAVQPIEMLRRLVEGVDNEPVIHLLCTELIEDPHDWQDAVDACRSMLEGVLAALKGVDPGGEVADPWATLQAAGFGKREDR